MTGDVQLILLYGGLLFLGLALFSLGFTHTGMLLLGIVIGHLGRTLAVRDDGEAS